VRAGLVYQVSTDASFRKKVFQHYFEKNPGGVRQYRASFDLMVKVDRRGRWNVEKKRNWRTYHPSVSHVGIVSLLGRFSLLLFRLMFCVGGLVTVGFCSTCSITSSW